MPQKQQRFATFKQSECGFAHLILLIVVVLLVGGAYYLGTQKNVLQNVAQKPETTPSSSTSPMTDETANWKTACQKTIDNPETKYKECVMTGGYESPEDEKMCEELGGKYNSCASVCRHNPKGGACLAVCVSLCTFD